MESHEPDLRAEIHDDDAVLAIVSDYHSANLDLRTIALLDFAVKLTRSPAEMTAADVAALRSVGFSDAEIVDAAQIVGYFNYSNRVMDALGIQPEPGMRHKPHS